MDVRIWFWCLDHPNPHVIDLGEGESVAQVMRALCVPLGDRSWCVSEKYDQIYCCRNDAGYCGEPTDGPGPTSNIVVPHFRERLGPPKIRERLGRKI